MGLAGAGGAICHLPHSFPRPAVLGQRWLAPWRGGVKSCCCWYCLLCWSLRITECQKPERSVPDCAGRGTAVYLCKGLSRRAPQEQLDAADPLVMERMLSGSLCPALHVFTLKGCALLTWGSESPAPRALAAAVLTSHPVQASPVWMSPDISACLPKSIGVLCL